MQIRQHIYYQSMECKIYVCFYSSINVFIQCEKNLHCWLSWLSLRNASLWCFRSTQTFFLLPATHCTAVYNSSVVCKKASDKEQIYLSRLIYWHRSSSSWVIWAIVFQRRTCDRSSSTHQWCTFKSATEPQSEVCFLVGVEHWNCI